MRPWGSVFTGIFFTAALGRVEDVDFIVVAAGEPELFAVDADIAHVRDCRRRGWAKSLSTLRVAKSMTLTLPLPLGGP